MGRRATPYVPRATHSSEPARETICRAHDPIYRAHDPAGVRDPMYRAHDLPGVRDSGTGDSGVRDPIYRAHGPFFRTRDLSGAGDFAPRNPTYPT